MQDDERPGDYQIRGDCWATRVHLSFTRASWESASNSHLVSGMGRVDSRSARKLSLRPVGRSDILSVE